ncbi:uncharacterized protein FOMMEDRAFT_16703 [Fomitiporia mediterranea MF3/22]|uniref:uncharacterized protein n=1 Tax=Fomitiporia mediterranea (strain MF3/22) TaxID=694068 RepID=UPI0004408C03|nr:uncharacterized protein FOMMEDRAFT_16703 [Fomitiporia mediterranea MF3/22]EJD08286.1 hypothetical protein FOMMEDRAFT_16703 [Fomitiporia mediterranea MF3/22]
MVIHKIRRQPSPAPQLRTPSPSDSTNASIGASDIEVVPPTPGDHHKPLGFGIGLADPLTSQKRQYMLHIADRLRSVGANADIEIPQIAVIGSQSAGKSSLLQRISGVDFPKSSGTCTRVPAEIILQEAAEGVWECTVSIRYIRDASGLLLGKPKIEEFGPVITNPSDVKDRMARAQIASLNPSRSCTEFLEGPPNPNFKSELSFSDNCIVVQIRGPNVSNLSLCDLPGLIASVAKGGKESDIDMIEKLVTSYIKNSNCLILLTVTCEADFETQGALRLALKHDPDGTRTLGVLTKPDRIANGDEDRWVKFVKYDDGPLALGWYCVKQPDSVQLAQGITLAEAQDKENEFFEVTEPWCSLPFDIMSRLGTKPLVENLSKTLADLISNRLPELRESVEKMIIQTKAALKELPIPPSEDAVAEASMLIMEFSKEVDVNVTGSANSDGLVRKMNSQQTKLKDAILQEAPEFLPYTKDNGYQVLPPITFLQKDGKGPFCNGMTVHVDEVVAMMEQARARELPGYTSFDVPAKILKETMVEWPKLANQYYERVFSTLNKSIKAIMDRHFKRYANLHSAARSTVQELLKRIGDETEQQIDKLLQREEAPFTLNSCYLSQYKDDFLAYYKNCRQKDLNGIAMQHIQNYTQLETSNPSLAVVRVDAVSQILAGLNTINIRDVKASDLPKLHKDPFDPALELMATVSAYYQGKSVYQFINVNPKPKTTQTSIQVAAKRFIDSVSLAVDYELLRTFAREIHRVLSAMLHRGDARERCAVYMQESMVVRKRRLELRSRLERLEAARQELNEYSPL